MEVNNLDQSVTDLGGYFLFTRGLIEDSSPRWRCTTTGHNRRGDIVAKPREEAEVKLQRRLQTSFWSHVLESSGVRNLL